MLRQSGAVECRVNPSPKTATHDASKTQIYHHHARGPLPTGCVENRFGQVGTDPFRHSATGRCSRVVAQARQRTPSSYSSPGATLHAGKTRFRGNCGRRRAWRVARAAASATAVDARFIEGFATADLRRDKFARRIGVVGRPNLSPSDLTDRHWLERPAICGQSYAVSYCCSTPNAR